MLSEAAGALAGAGGAAVVQAMVSDGWETTKGRLARLLGRGAPDEVTDVERRLESARAELASLPESDLEQAIQEQATIWHAHLIGILESDPEAEAELRTWLNQSTPGGPRLQQAVLNTGIQINKFAGPPAFAEVVSTIAVPTGRRYEDRPLRGRDELITELLAARSGVHVLYGLGGAGKSSVALEAACRAQEEQCEVWWIPATDADRVTMGMLNLARRLGLSRAEVGHRDIADLLWQRLADRESPWLLVFDNTDDLDVLTIGEAPLRDGTGWLRPIENPRGKAIVTSRHGRTLDWGRWCRLHPVGMLSPAEGARVLLDKASPRAGTQAEAEALSRRLGGLPLALRLAGSYLAQSQRMPSIFTDPDRALTFGEYEAAVEKGLLGLEFPSQQIPVSDREARQMLGRTWGLSLELLERRGIGPVRALISLLSCFADAPVPHEMLLAPATLADSSLFPSSLTGAEAWESLLALNDTGLLDLMTARTTDDIPALRLHPLVRDVSRPAEHGARYLATAAKLLVGAAHGKKTGLPEDPAKWHLWQMLVPHCLHVLVTIKALPESDSQARQDAAQAAYMSARHLAATGAYPQAKAVYAEVLAVRDRSLGAEHNDTLNARYGLARMAAGQGLYEEAESGFKEVLTQRERVLGTDHPDTLNARYGLARMAAAQGRYREAEETYREIMLIGQRAMGPDHPETLRARFGIARMASEQGRYGEAEALYRSLLRSSEEHGIAPFGDHSEHQESKTVYREVLAVEERVLGPDQPDALTIRYAIARMASAQGRFDEAERAYREVRSLEEESLGVDHPDTLTTSHWIARMVHAQGRHREAEDLLRRVLDRRVRVLGVNHPHTLTTRYWMARTLTAQGRRHEAEPLLQQVLSDRRRVLAEGHPQIAQTVRTLERLRGTG
ncbi:tetratricopeptide repeat protein [Actinomadura sp. 6K520]|jgi:tetratricopeptide (TPR) repeat protein|uniref:tetratricopeptide repeat protein n=1 Tax=Actinomadura sp. 6K520 TaxID=2530364 RepID=UPI0010D1C1AC|nr:tetratricopeptide repeat protein [Actinomadura sp. 6K520]TDE24947.1 tetratricopeptide repeat protein [Actinomadura sp. 6K520]